jgi:S1-C subfamily serine protease
MEPEQTGSQPPPQPIVRVTAEEVARAVPPPPLPRYQLPVPPPAPKGPRVSRLAVAALVFGVLGIPLTFLVGGIALVSGAIALAITFSNPDLRGKKLALSGLLLGLVSCVGWSWALWYYLGKPGAGHPDGPPRLLEAAGGPPPEGIRTSPEPYRTALMANVVVMGSAGIGKWTGSGIVVDREGENLRILTNRHVAEGPAGSAGTATLWILLSSGETAAATAVWRAPSGVDLCVLEMKSRTATEVTVVRLASTAVSIAEEVFAVGNPMEYRWSLTKGVISSVRTVEMGGERVKVYQTQTPISSGNSGGGLYTHEGHLVGVNTWTADKSVSEGLGFSISVDTLLEVLGRSNLPWAARLIQAAGHP